MSSTKKKKLQRKKIIERQTKLSLNNLSISNESEFFVLKKKLTKDALFLFGKENCFRDFCLRVSTNNIFLQSINFTVLISSIFLVLETYDDKKVLEVSYIFGLVFLGIYIIEFLLKIVAFGFCIGRNTYLTDAWNVLDLLIIISGAISLFPQIENDLYFIRVLKIVRPLKALTAIPNMKAFISSLLFSLMDLFIVFIILLFFFIIFALIGLSLWSDIFDYRCRTGLFPVNGTLGLDKSFSRLCGGGNLCNNNTSLCLSSKDLWDNKLYFFDPNKKSNGFDYELYTADLNYGLTTFRNFFNSLYIVFQVTTLEGWGNIMFIVMSAHESILAAIYFISLIILNNYFMLNLLVAILLFNFEKNYQMTEKEDNAGSNFSVPQLGGSAAKKSGNELDNNIDIDNENINDSNLNKSGSSNVASLVNKKNSGFSLNENSNNNSINFSLIANNSNNKVGFIDKSFGSGKDKGVYNKIKEINNVENNYLDDPNNKDSANAFASMSKDIKKSKNLNLNASKSTSKRITEEKLSSQKKCESDNKLINLDKLGFNVKSRAEDPFADSNYSDNDIKNIQKKENSIFSAHKINSINQTNLEKKSNNQLSKNKQNTAKEREKDLKELRSSYKMNSFKNNLPEPEPAESARVLLNDNDAVSGMDNYYLNSYKKREQAELLIEDVSFYDPEELLDSINSEDTNKNKSSVLGKNESYQVNNMSAKSKSEIADYQLLVRNKSEITRAKRPNKFIGSNDNFKFQSLDLSKINNSPRTVNANEDKKGRNKAINNFNRLFNSNKLQNKDVEITLDCKKNLIRNKNKQKLNDNLNESNNSSFNSICDKKPIKSISDFTIGDKNTLDKNTSTNFLLKIANAKASKVENSRDNGFNNNNNNNNKNKFDLRSTIFSINNKINTNNSKFYDTKRISDTQLLNRKPLRSLSKPMNIEPRKRASLAVIGRTNRNSSVADLIDHNILNNRLSNTTLNNTNKLFKSMTNNISGAKPIAENKISGKDLEKLLRKYRKKYSKIQPIEREKFDIFKPHKSFLRVIKDIPFFINFRKTSAYHKQNKIAFWCYYLINQPIVQYFIYFCITFNFIILVIERKGQKDNEIQLIELLNKILVFVFITECLLLLVATGLKNFFMNIGNTIDFVLVVFSLIELIFINEQTSNKGNTSVTSSFKILRIMRILKLVRSWHGFRIMILSIIDTGKRMVNYFILLFIFIYVYAIVGCNIFKGSLRFNKDTNKYDKNGDQLFDNFDTFTNAFLNVFYLIIGDGWYNMFFDCYRSDANNSIMTIIYFISVILIGQLCMLNIFMAYLIDNFKISRQELFKNIEVKKKIFSYIPKIGLELHNKEVVRSHQKNKYKSPFLALVNFFATQHERNWGHSVLLQTNFNFEARIHISFKNEGKSAQTYFRRQRANKKGSEKEKTLYDKSEDFEILYRNEAFYYNEKKDLFIDLVFVANLEMWKKEKLKDLLYEKNEEQLIYMSNNADADKKNKNKNEEINKPGFVLESLPTDSCGVIRNKTVVNYGRNNIANNYGKENNSSNRLSFGIFRNTVNSRKSFGLSKDCVVLVNHPFGKFRELRSHSLFPSQTKTQNKTQNNLLSGQVDDIGKLKEEEFKANKSKRENSSQKLAKVSQDKIQLDFLEGKAADYKITESDEINPYNALCEESKQTNSNKKKSNEVLKPNLKDSESKTILRVNEQLLNKHQEKNEPSDSICYNNMSRDEFVALDSEKVFSATSEVKKDYSRKFTNDEIPIEKKVLVPLKSFIKKYEFIQSEDSNISEEKAPNDDQTFKISFDWDDKNYRESNASKYSISKKDWSLNNDISDENLHQIALKNYELTAVYTEANKNTSLPFNLVKEKKFGKQVRLNSLKRTNSLNINMLSKNTNLNNIEYYFRELDLKYNKDYETDKEENNLNLSHKENDNANNKYECREHDINYLNGRENKKEINFMRNKIKINGDQVVLKPRKDKAKNFFFTRVNFFQNPNLNKEIVTEKKFTLMKCKTSTVDPDSQCFVESSRIPNKTLTINNFSVKSNRIAEFPNTGNNHNFALNSKINNYYSLTPEKNTKEQDFNLTNSCIKKDKKEENDVLSLINFDFHLDKESKYNSDSNISEDLKGCISKNIKGYNLNKVSYKSKKLLDLKTETGVKDIRFHSDNNFSFDKEMKQLMEPEKKSTLQANVHKLIDIFDNFNNKKNSNEEKLKTNKPKKRTNLKKANNVAYNSNERSIDSNSDHKKENEKSFCKAKYTLQDLKNPEFIQDNKWNFNEVLFQCLNKSDDCKGKNAKEKMDIEAEGNQEKSSDTYSNDNSGEYEDIVEEEEEFVDFDVILDKHTRNSIGKHKCKNIVEIIDLKNIFNVNASLKKDYYLNDPSLAENLGDLYLVKKETNKNPIQDPDSMSFRNSTKSEITLPQAKMEDSLILFSKEKSIDNQTLNGICDNKKSSVTNDVKADAGKSHLNKIYKSLNVDEEIFLNEQKFNANKNKLQPSLKNISNSLNHNYVTINNTDTYKDLEKERATHSFHSNDHSKLQSKNHKTLKSKFNLNVKNINIKDKDKSNLFSDRIPSNENKNANQTLEKEEVHIVPENPSFADTSSFSSEYEPEEFFLLEIYPNSENNLFSELKKTEFTIDLEQELNFNHLYIKVKNLFYKVSLKPLFAEYPYEKKIVRDRMSIFNLISTNKPKKETLAYESLEKEINETVKKATETIIRKTLNEYLKEKAQGAVNGFNRNKNENILQTFQSSLTRMIKFPYIFINNPLTDSRTKEKFLSIFYIFNAKSWEIVNTEFNNKLQRQHKKQNYLDKLKSKIRERNKQQTEQLKHWSFSLRERIKDYIFNSSMGIFHKEWKIRIFFARVVLSNYFEYAIMIFILFNCVFLILDNPWNDPDGWVANAILYTNNIFTFIFMAESLMKIIAFGLLFGQKDIPAREEKPKQSPPMDLVRNRRNNLFSQKKELKAMNDIQESNQTKNKLTRRVNILGGNKEKEAAKNFGCLPAAGEIEAGTIKKNANINNRKRSNFSADNKKDRLSAKSANSAFKRHSDSNSNPNTNKNDSNNLKEMCNDDNKIKSRKSNDNIADNGDKGKNIEDSNELKRHASHSVTSKAKDNLDFKSKQTNASSSKNKNNILRNLNNLNNLNILENKNSLITKPKKEPGMGEEQEQIAKLKTKATLIPSAISINNLNNNLSNSNTKQSQTSEINLSLEDTFDSNISSSDKAKGTNDPANSPKTINFSNHSGYLNNLSNFIDFFVVILGFIDVISTDDIAAAKYLRTMRMLRSIRPIRIITKNENLKMILTCLIKSIPAIGNILIIGILFIFIYAIVGVNLFKNTLDFYCSDNQVTEELDCLQQGLSWFVNQQNFNNIFSALKTLFTTLTTQNWVWLMNLAYFKNSRSFSVYIYFISFIIFANFFILNLFVSVIVEKFQSLKEKKNKLFSLTEEEKDWIKVQKIMLKFNPNIKLNEDECSYWQLKIYRVITNMKFEILSIFFILLAILLLGLQFNGAQPGYNSMLQLINYGLTFFFNVELLFKLFVYRKNFFISRWNFFDFVVIMLCNAVLIMNILEQMNIIDNNSKLSTLPGIFRALRILRVLRLIAVYPNLRTLIDTLVYLVPSIGNIGLIMLILFTIYGCIGVNLFGTVPLRENIHEYNNFRNFPNAVLLLFKVTTGDDWSVMMNELAYHDCRRLEDYLSTVELSDDLNRRVVWNYYRRLQIQWDSEGNDNKYFNYYVNGILNPTNISKFDLSSNLNAGNHNLTYGKEGFYYDSIYTDYHNIHNFNYNYNHKSFDKSKKKKVSTRTYSVYNRKEDKLKQKQNSHKDAFTNEYQKAAYSLNQTDENKYPNRNAIESSAYSHFKPTLSDFYHRNLQSFQNLTLSFNNTVFSLTNKTLSKIEDFIITRKQDFFCQTFKEVFCSNDDNITYAMLTQGLGFSCGTDFSYIYFISFVIIGPIFVMNLCVVIVVEGFSESMLENESLLSQCEMDRFISVWINYDSRFSKTVTPYEMVLILKEIDPPLGINYDRLFIHNPLKSWKNFKMKNKIRKTLEDNVAKLNKEFKHNENVEMFVKGNNLNSDGNRGLNNALSAGTGQANAEYQNVDLEKNLDERRKKTMNSYSIGGKSNNNYFKDNENDKNSKSIEMQQLDPSFSNKNLSYNDDYKRNLNSNNNMFKTQKEILNSQTLKNLNKLLFSKNNQIRGDDGIKIVKRGFNTYSCNSFFFDQSLKFWTYNSEIIRIVDFFGFKIKPSDSGNEKNNSNVANQVNDILLKANPKDGVINKVHKKDLYDGLNIHFVDACLSLSKYLTSKKHSIIQDSLREKVVKNITKKMWKKKFNLKPEDFESKKKNMLSENLSLRMLAKIKPKLKNMLENARRKIYIRKLNENN